ncbi:T9SS type A sorting domain-containing protein [Bacteroides sp.]
MKNFITKTMICGAIAIMGFSATVDAQCTNFTYYPEKQTIGWNSSEWYKIIDLDAATLTDATKYPRTGAIDGMDDNVIFGDNTLRAPTGDGNITVPLYDPTGNVGEYTPSGHNYDIKFVRCVFAPDHYTSALAKDDNGMLPSGESNACTINNNTCLVGNVYGKQGFIELSRQAAAAGEPLSSKCGYIQLDNLYGVDRVQWSYSSTSWKRGVICEIRYGGEGAEWYPRRIIPSDTQYYATFSEQGYEFEEEIGAVEGEDVEIPISLRFRIFDCDTLTWAHEYELDPKDRSAEYYYARPSALQPVRIHQIKVFSAFTGSEIAQKIQATGIKGVSDEHFIIKKEGTDICASEECLMELYTIAGKQIRRTKGTKMGVSDLDKGIYILKATGSDGTVKNSKFSL